MQPPATGGSKHKSGIPHGHKHYQNRDRQVSGQDGGLKKDPSAKNL